MHIEIETEDLLPGQITGRKDGTVYFTLEQPALLFTDKSRYPLQFKIRHAFTQNKAERDQIGAIAVGKYLLADNAFAVGRFGSLELAEINAKHLKPFMAQVPANDSQESAPSAVAGGKGLFSSSKA